MKPNSKTILLAKRKGGFRNDKRAFFICPKCKSDNINQISIYTKIAAFTKNVKTKEKLAVDKSKGMTLCRDCLYSVGTL